MKLDVRLRPGKAIKWPSSQNRCQSDIKLWYKCWAVLARGVHSHNERYNSYLWSHLYMEYDPSYISSSIVMGKLRNTSKALVMNTLGTWKCHRQTTRSCDFYHNDCITYSNLPEPVSISTHSCVRNVLLTYSFLLISHRPAELVCLQAIQVTYLFVMTVHYLVLLATRVYYRLIWSDIRVCAHI